MPGVSEVDEVRETLSALKPSEANALRLEACKSIKYVTHLVEEGRKDIARLYSRAVGGTPVEHEMGECLALVRKAEKRLLEAYTELAQQELPLE